MEKSFYQAENPQKALKIYFQGENELYARIKNKTIESVLSRIIKKEKFNTFDVLEIGPGGGVWTDYFIKKGAKITCVDISEQVLKGNKKLHPGAKFILADATTIKLENEFDIIFVKDVIEHIENDNTFLLNMKKYLKKDGYMLINTQNSFSLNYLLQGGFNLLKGNKKWRGWDPTHKRFYNVRLLKKEFKKSGFTPVSWFGSYYFPYRVFSEKFGKIWECKAFYLIEELGLFDKRPFNVLGWNIGVIVRKNNLS